MQNVDYIIIGQGLAGTTLAHRLISANKSICIIDECSHDTCSKVSSGMLNPITGRRYVKSWMFDEFLDEALTFYKTLEELLGLTLIKPHTMLRGLHSVIDENQWLSQSSKSDFEKYFGDVVADTSVYDHFTNDVRFGAVKHSYRLNVANLILNSRSYFEELGVIRKEKVEVDDIEIAEQIRYKDISAHAIIFAEGWKVIQNTLFSSLPFAPLKGEILICKLDDYEVKEIVKNKKFIVPLGNDRYWVGSTNEWEFDDDRPNFEKRKELIEFLDSVVNRKYEILSSHTGIRPSTKYRKPFLGTHPDFDNVYLFNGLGTKGASMAPYMSKMLLEHIMFNKPIMEELDITRFFA